MTNVDAVEGIQKISPSNFSRMKLQDVIDNPALSFVCAPRSTSGPACEGPFRFRAVDPRESTSDAKNESGWLHNPIEYYGEITNEAQHILDSRSAYDRRIDVLQEQAELDGYSLNDASKDAFWKFFRRNPLIGRGRLVLMENGNLRAIWKGGAETHIGLQFQNSRSVQYVIFTRRERSAPVSRVSGRDTMDGIAKQIDAFDLRDVLYM